jgi:hypothetical protein
MIQFKRYPHVKDLITHYANYMNEPSILLILEQGVNSEQEATDFAQFIWQMVGQMGIDSENGVSVLGRTDNTDTIPDIDYEISLQLANLGFEEIWNKICDSEQD